MRALFKALKHVREERFEQLKASAAQRLLRVLQHTWYVYAVYSARLRTTFK